MKTERLDNVIKALLIHGEEVNNTNVLFYSLFHSGGTLTNEEEVNEHIKNNYFVFIDGNMYTNRTDNTLIVNSTILKVKDSLEFTHSFKKTIVKAIDGIDGLQKHLKENRCMQDLFFHSLNNITKSYK